jgi:hypothetical protein
MEDPSFTLLPSRIAKQTLPLFWKFIRRPSKNKNHLEMEIKVVLEKEDYTNDQITLRRYPKQCGQNPPFVSKTKR